MDHSDSLPGTTTPGTTTAPSAPPDAEGTPQPVARIRGLLLRAARAVALWPALAMLLIGLYQVTRPELWRDELASWALSTRTLPQLFAATRSSGAAQEAYYLILHFWIRAFGDSVLAMRMLSVLAMSGAAACVALTGRRLFSPRAGLAAGLVLAVVPSISRFAQEVRFYALATLAAALATLLLLRAIDRPGWWRWIAYALCVACVGYLNPVALTLLAGHAAVAAFHWQRQHPWRPLAFLPAAVAGVALTFPVIVTGSSQAKAQIGWIHRPDVHLLSQYGANLFYSTAILAAMVPLAVLAWSARTRGAASATAVAALPVAAVWALSQGSVSYFFPRYLVFTVTAWALLAGAAIAMARLPVAVAAIVALAAISAADQHTIRLPGAHGWANYPSGPGGFATSYTYRSAAQVIARQLQPGDGIVYQRGRKQLRVIDYGVEYYLRHDLAPGTALPRELFIAQTAAQRGSLYPALCTDPAACAGQPPRVWIVDSGRVRNPYGTIPAAQRAVLRGSYRVSEILQPGHMTVTLLVRSPHTPRKHRTPMSVAHRGSR
ncbi:MAG: glycosyltransferase family 39 protein [Micromonosporaceae bacterium]